MYLKSLREKKLTKTIGFKLTLWYALVTIFISILLFTVAYFQVSSEIDAENRYMIKDEIKEYVMAYQLDGWEGLSGKFELEHAKKDPSTYFVRIVNSNTHTTLLNIPGAYKGLDVRKLEQEHLPPTEEGWTYLPVPTDTEDLLDIAWQRLPNGILLQVGRNSDIGVKLLAQSRIIFAGIIISTIILGFIGGGLLAFRALRPIKDLVNTMTTIKNGKMDARVPTSATGDELDHLIMLVNDMLNEIDLLVKGLRDTLDNVAHDLRTPITRMKVITEHALSSGADSEKLKEVVMACAEEADRISLLLTTLMDISEAETGTMQLHFAWVDVRKLIDNAIELYRYLAADKGVTIAVEGPDQVLGHVDQTRFQQVLANLLDNAVKYTESGGRITTTLIQEKNGVTVSIRDSGIGIPPADIPRIFDRLYRSDKSRHKKGLGLGLSLVKAIVNAHHGHIEVESRVGEGSTFILFFPDRPVG